MHDHHVCVTECLAFHFGFHINRFEQPHSHSEQRCSSCASSRLFFFFFFSCEGFPAKNRPVDINIIIMPACHCSFGVCICRTCHRREKKIIRWRCTLFLSPSLSWVKVKRVIVIIIDHYWSLSKVITPCRAIGLAVLCGSKSKSKQSKSMHEHFRYPLELWPLAAPWSNVLTSGSLFCLYHTHAGDAIPIPALIGFILCVLVRNTECKCFFTRKHCSEPLIHLALRVHNKHMPSTSYLKREGNW